MYLKMSINTHIYMVITIIVLLLKIKQKRQTQSNFFPSYVPWFMEKTKQVNIKLSILHSILNSQSENSIAAKICCELDT